MFSQETTTDVHDRLNFNYCLVGNSNEAHLATSKVFPFVNWKRQTNTADKGVVLL